MPSVRLWIIVAVLMSALNGLLYLANAQSIWPIVAANAIVLYAIWLVSRASAVKGADSSFDEGSRDDALPEELIERAITSPAFDDDSESESPAFAAGLILSNIQDEIFGLLQNVMKESDALMIGDLTWAQRRKILSIRENAASLEEAFSGAFDFDAVDAGDLKLQATVFSLREFLSDAFAPFVQHARQRDRSLTYFVQTRVPDTLKGDPGRLRDALETLLDLLEADAATDPLEIRVSVESREEHDIAIRFVFAGGDMESAIDELSPWLDESARAQHSMQTHTIGELSFALTVRTIEALGGRLEVLDEDSRPPRLSVTTRLTVVETPRGHSSEQSVLGLIPDLPVLLVHRDDDERERLKAMLLRWQTEPTCVATPAEMWQALERSRSRDLAFGLLIMSHDLDGASGRELCSDLQRHQLHSSVPRILLVPKDESRIGSRELTGLATHVVPPVEPSELAKAILSSVLGKGRFKQMRNGIGAAEMYVRSLIPSPTLEPIRIDWRYVPAADLAGDALGYQWIDDDHCAVYVIDVCGHGLDASLLSVTILNVLKSMTLPETDFRRPDQVLAQLNCRFPMELHGDRGFTAWYGVYHRSACELRWSGGGHPPALLFPSAQGSPEDMRQLESDGPMIGMIPDLEFTSRTCQVPKGSRLLIYSDGVFELEDPDGRSRTFDEFVKFAREYADQDDLLDKLWHRAQASTGSPNLDDDFTVLDVAF